MKWVKIWIPLKCSAYIIAVNRANASCCSLSPGYPDLSPVSLRSRYTSADKFEQPALQVCVMFTNFHGVNHHLVFPDVDLGKDATHQLSGSSNEAVPTHSSIQRPYPRGQLCLISEQNGLLSSAPCIALLLVCFSREARSGRTEKIRHSYSLS
jgi:hypothetical protein